MKQGAILSMVVRVMQEGIWYMIIHYNYNAMKTRSFTMLMMIIIIKIISFFRTQ